MAEEVLDENNREIYITMSQEVNWDGSFYNDTTGLFNEYTIGTVCNALAFSIFNVSKAGVTLHCTYDPETQTYEMEYLYYLMDLYDFSFLGPMEEQDALGIAKNYELYGVSEGHATWQKGDDLMLLYPHTIMERTDF